MNCIIIGRSCYLHIMEWTLRWIHHSSLFIVTIGIFVREQFLRLGVIALDSTISAVLDDFVAKRPPCRAIRDHLFFKVVGCNSMNIDVFIMGHDVSRREVWWSSDTWRAKCYDWEWSVDWMILCFHDWMGEVSANKKLDKSRLLDDNRRRDNNSYWNKAANTILPQYPPKRLKPPAYIL